MHISNICEIFMCSAFIAAFTLRYLSHRLIIIYYIYYLSMIFIRFIRNVKLVRTAPNVTSFLHAYYDPKFSHRQYWDEYDPELISESLTSACIVLSFYKGTQLDYFKSSYQAAEITHFFCVIWHFRKSLYNK